MGWGFFFKPLGRSVLTCTPPDGLMGGGGLAWGKYWGSKNDSPPDVLDHHPGAVGPGPTPLLLWVMRPPCANALMRPWVFLSFFARLWASEPCDRLDRKPGGGTFLRLTKVTTHWCEVQRWTFSSEPGAIVPPPPIPEQDVPGHHPKKLSPPPDRSVKPRRQLLRCPQSFWFLRQANTFMDGRWVTETKKIARIAKKKIVKSTANLLINLCYPHPLPWL